MLGSDARELLPGSGLDASVGEELAEVALIGPAGMRGGGTEHPRPDGFGHLVAEVGRQATGEGRNGVSDGLAGLYQLVLFIPLHHPSVLVRITHFIRTITGQAKDAS